LDLREVWAFRELLALLVWRDISVRYKQSVAGIGWAVIQPLLTMLIFSVIFGRLAKLPSDGLPYPVFAYCGLLPWNYFAKSLGGSSDSLVASSYLVKKVYFPRLILPISKVASGLIDFAIAFVLLFVMMAWYGIAPSAVGILFLPVFILIAMMTALGMGLWFTALNVRYRDVGFLVPFLSQSLMYASPVLYSTSLIPAKWRWLYGLNPMVGVIEGFRWALLGKSAPDVQMMLISLGVVGIVLVTGLFFFRKMEKTFADVV